MVFSFLACALFGIQSSGFSATIDPALRFSTLETDHFVIHFHQGLDDIAKKAAVITENAYSNLTAEFQWSPREKTQVILFDVSDFANGFATVLPYNAIYIYVVPPHPDMSIGEYEDWIETVIIHEYAHILTLDPVRGYSSFMRKVFGKPAAVYDPLSALFFLAGAPPNIFMPYWWIEGIPTWTETEFTSMGRGRSTFFEMIFRMDVLEDHIPSIDQINGDVPNWPGPRLRYIYGMLLTKYIAGKYGKETLGKINIKQAGRAPFFISASPRTFSGKNYVGLYRDMVEEVKEEQNAKIQHLRSTPPTKYVTLPLNGELLTNPRVSPDGGYLAVNRRDPHMHEEIVIADARTLEEFTTIRRLPSDRSLSWSPDRRKLYFTQAELRGGFNLYQDIYAYDFADNSVERITRNLRAKDVDVSPDGGRIAFVKVEAERRNIAVLNIGDKGEVEVVTDTHDSALSGPRWSPDGKAVVFSERNNKGETAIEMYSIESNTTRTLLRDGHSNIHPTWSPDGRYIIFTSDRTGVFNLYAYSTTDGKIFQVTHVLGGAFQADVYKDGGMIVFSGYHAKGYYIAEMPFDPSKWFEESGPDVKPMWEARTELQASGGKSREENVSPPPMPLSKEKEVSEISDKKAPEYDSGKRAYSAGPTLTPRFWLPTLQSDHEGVVVGAFTAGQDVLGYHSYLLQAGYGESSQIYIDGNYVYDRWYPSFFVRGYSQPAFYSGFFDDDNDYYERRSSLVAGIRIPLNFIESRYGLIGGYGLEKVEPLTAIRGRRVDDLVVFEGRRDNIFVGFEYSGALKYPYSISREEGRNISLMYRDFSKSRGSELNQREYAARYEEYIGMGRHHVVYLNLRGATSDGDLIAQQAFQLGRGPISGNDYPLRGFSQGFETGRSVVTGSLEYRFPIKYILRGVGTKPFFWDRLHIALFTDAGNVWGHGKGFDMGDFDVGIGAEARFDVVIGYKLKITPAAGIAQGITGGGETQVYLTVYTDL